MKTISQNERIKALLLSGKKITPLQAFYKFGILRLGARIYNLKQQGMRIKSELIEVSDGVRVAEYSL